MVLWGELLDPFGPAALPVGPDFPAERLAGDLGLALRACGRGLQNLSDRQRAEVLAGTARRFYRIPIQVR